ncbi:MAG: hypothetical protein Q4A37_01945 [Candidatus Saccharibacteria bacterium]|nr:hypothetical protein [Candidatus Saccharibacteria bacterium]
MKRKSISMAICAALIAPLLIGSTTFAAQCGGAETSIISCSGEGQDAVINILKMVIQIMTAGVGVLAIGAVAFGGVVYASSSGDPGKMKKAYEIWTNTVIGILLFVFLVAITNFMIPGGVFS